MLQKGRDILHRQWSAVSHNLSVCLSLPRPLTCTNAVNVHSSHCLYLPLPRTCTNAVNVHSSHRSFFQWSRRPTKSRLKCSELLAAARPFCAASCRVSSRTWHASCPGCRSLPSTSTLRCQEVSLACCQRDNLWLCAGLWPPEGLGGPHNTGLYLGNVTNQINDVKRGREAEQWRSEDDWHLERAVTVAVSDSGCQWQKLWTYKWQLLLKLLTVCSLI